MRRLCGVLTFKQARNYSPQFGHKFPLISQWWPSSSAVKKAGLGAASFS